MLSAGFKRDPAVFIYANNEPKSVLAQDLDDCHDNEMKRVKCIASRYEEKRMEKQNV